MASGGSSSSALSRGGGDGETRLGALALDKVAEAADAIAVAVSAGEVVRAIHAVAALLFPVDSAAVAGTVEEPFRTQIIESVSLSDGEREAWRHAFYHGPAFPTMSKILVGNVAMKWLQKIHASARNEVYDSFFVKGPPTEVIQALIPALSQKVNSKEEDRNFSSNIERLLVLCLLDHKGVSKIIAEFTHSIMHDDGIVNLDKPTFITRVAQLLASIPDKISLRSSPALTAPLFFKDIVSQLLVGAESAIVDLAADKDGNEHCALSYVFLFVGEMLSRISRRGSTGILVTELIPMIHDHLNRCKSDHKTISPDMILSVSQSQFWSNIVESMKDQHCIERLTEELLRQLALQHTSDEEAYWILWVLFNQSFMRLTVMR